MENNENCIEFITNSHTATVTFTNKKHINRVKKLFSERKEEFKRYTENSDGSVCATLPLKWVKLNAGSKTRRVMTEEQKEAARIRLAEARKKMNNT